MRKILVLTNGEIAFTFENVKRVAIFNEGDMRILREEVVKKIPQSIRGFLGIK
jgi:hypothetical protein